MASMQRPATRFLVAALFMALLAGCATDHSTPLAPPEQVQGTGTTPGRGVLRSLVGGVIDVVDNILGSVAGAVTPQSGGILHLLHSDFVVTPSAVPSAVTIRWTILEQTPQGLAGAGNRVHSFGPEGLLFQRASVWYVDFDDAGVSAGEAAHYRCYYFNEGTHTWEPQQTTVDAAHHRFVVTIHHFSRYAFGR